MPKTEKARSSFEPRPLTYEHEALQAAWALSASENFSLKRKLASLLEAGGIRLATKMKQFIEPDKPILAGGYWSNDWDELAL